MRRSYNLGGIVTGFCINGSQIDCICENRVSWASHST